MMMTVPAAGLHTFNFMFNKRIEGGGDENNEECHEVQQDKSKNKTAHDKNKNRRQWEFRGSDT